MDNTFHHLKHSMKKLFISSTKNIYIQQFPKHTNFELMAERVKKKITTLPALYVSYYIVRLFTNIIFTTINYLYKV
jgi:hypothetical protein